jgi:hypothetical protein
MAQLDGNTLPDTMYAQGHEIIHQVVLVGDRVEDFSYQLGLLAYGNLSEAKMGSFFRHLKFMGLGKFDRCPTRKTDMPQLLPGDPPKSNPARQPESARPGAPA